MIAVAYGAPVPRKTKNTNQGITTSGAEVNALLRWGNLGFMNDGISRRYFEEFALGDCLLAGEIPSAKADPTKYILKIASSRFYKKWKVQTGRLSEPSSLL